MLKKRNQEFLNEISQKQAEIKQVVLKYQQLSEVCINLIFLFCDYWKKISSKIDMY